MSEGFTPESLGAKLEVVPGQHQRLRQGVLGLLDISAATMANIGPAMSFYFGFGYLAYTAGLASPLTIIAAGVAILLLGNTLSEFTKVLPSTGGFISFIGKTFGGRVAVTTAILTGAGYIAAMASVISIVGGFFQTILQNYNVKGLESVPWIVWVLVFLAFASFMMIRGISVSTKLAGFFFAFEMTIMILVSIITLVKFHGSINFRPFEPKNITGGFKGLAAGFPLAIYLFIGWENSAALAEETDNPRKNVPRAVFTSILIMLVAYTFFAFSTVVGFQDNVAKLSGAAIPFISVAKEAFAVLLFFAFLAGMTSTLGALIAGTNSQARLIFNAGREGLLPSMIGKVDAKRRTPVNALLVFLGLGLAIIGIWGLGHLIGGHGNPHYMVAGNMFVESSTFGTILLLLVYGTSNLALPFYYRKYHPELFNGVRHGLLPVLGTLWILVPLYYLAKPGQPTPYNWYPYMALGAVILAVIYALILVQRDPAIGDRVGSIVADE
ncbi:MAG: APC family permease [Actinomycetota bacterium]|jgi:amino acid transporter|nr:APC family permease [Actinomycetota bacterium]